MQLWITVKESPTYCHDTTTLWDFCVQWRCVGFFTKTLQSKTSNLFLFFFRKYCCIHTPLPLYFWNITHRQFTELISLLIHSFCQGEAGQSGETVYLWGNTSHTDLLLTDTPLAFTGVKHWFAVSHPHSPPFSLRRSITRLYSSNRLFNPLTSFSILEPEHVEPTVLRDSDVPVILPNRWGC